jgi:prepilin-type N-terminal cleavage/methylation domain-containing protein
MTFTTVTHRSARRAMRAAQRRGFTLIEVVLVVGMASVILGAIGVVLHGVWRADLTARRHGTTMSSLAAVAAQFRRDVHAGQIDSSAPLAGDSLADGLVIALPDDQAIEYRAAAGGITREVRGGGQISHRETYALPSGATAGWRRSAADSLPLVSLLVDRPREANQSALAGRRVLRIDAVVGLDQTRVAAQRASNTPSME